MTRITSLAVKRHDEWLLDNFCAGQKHDKVVMLASDMVANGVLTEEHQVVRLPRRFVYDKYMGVFSSNEKYWDEIRQRINMVMCRFGSY